MMPLHVEDAVLLILLQVEESVDLMLDHVYEAVHLMLVHVLVAEDFIERHAEEAVLLIPLPVADK